MQKYEMSSNQEAMGRFGMVMAFIIVAAVTIYSDVMFIQVMWNVFPPGFMRIGGIIGALATGASILLLLICKKWAFRPGDQLVAAYVFTGAEIFVSIANVLLATEVAQKSVNSVMVYWQYISPATPFVAGIGWIILSMLDSSTKMRHKVMEMEEQKETSELNYQIQVHQAHMGVKTQHLAQVSEQLNTVINSPAVQKQIADHAQRMVAKVLTDVTGLSAFNTDVSTGKVVDSTLASVSMSQIASAPHTPVQPTPAPSPVVEEPKKKVEASEDLASGSNGGSKTQTQLPNSKRRSTKQGN